MTVATSPTAPADQVQFTPSEMLALDHVHTWPGQPRQHFAEAPLKELAASIGLKGVIEPIVVRRRKNNHGFEVIAGERRYRASKLAGLQFIPAVVRNLSEADALELAVTENVQRQNFTPIEECAAFRRLVDASPGVDVVTGLARRMSKDVRYVWDRIKVDEHAIPQVKQLVEEGRIGIGHAIVIARLKPRDQERVIAPGSDISGYGRFTSGLWLRESAGALAFEPGAPKSIYDGLKPKAIRELEHWISAHVRFDVQHAATMQPLEFTTLAELVVKAEQAAGPKGPRPIAITFSHALQPDVKSEDERTYGPLSFRFADGEKHVDEATNKQAVFSICQYARLGVVVDGERRGQSWQVCVARDRCEVHWRREIADRQKTQQLKDTGKGEEATRREKASDDKRQREAAVAEAKRAAWRKLEPLIVDEAIDQVRKVRKLTAKQGRFMTSGRWVQTEAVANHLGKTWWKSPAAAWLVAAIDDQNCASFEVFITHVAKPLGLNVKRLEAVRAKHQPAAAKGAQS